MATIALFDTPAFTQHNTGEPIEDMRVYVAMSFHLSFYDYALSELYLMVRSIFDLRVIPKSTSTPFNLTRTTVDKWRTGHYLNNSKLTSICR